VDTAVSTTGLTKHYGRAVALDDLDLAIPKGVVFGYLGPNGAGKTTTIRILLGLLKPTKGSAQVLGLPVPSRRNELHRKVGYLPGDFFAYPAMSGEAYLRYLAKLRGNVEWEDVRSLAKRFDLDLDARIGSLSHGNRQKVGVIQAFMHRPELLVLDEPTSGLDPLMQREFLTLLDEARSEGRTVLLSSHILAEVEEVADLVAILRDGRLVVVESVAGLTAKALRRLELSFEKMPALEDLEGLPGVAEARFVGSTAHLVVEGTTEELFRFAAPFGIEAVVTPNADLEEIFLDYYAGER
jgi:ABC-2 type transport system ATP-binding protein